MELIRLQGIAKDYGHRPVLRDASLRINEGARAGLIGPNGAGKTSLLRIITGEELPTAGAVTRASHLRVGYVPQYVEAAEGESALDLVLAPLREAAAALHAAGDALAAAAGAGVAPAEEAYVRAQAVYDAAGGDAAEERAVAMLDAMGLAGRADDPAAAMSGGEKNVLGLARALIAQPSLLVLDEPGNHLDFEGLAWLESYLRSFRGAVLLVSHNRYLLDRVTDTTIRIEDGATRTFAGNYSASRAVILREKIAQQADYAVNQKRLAQLEALVKRFQEYAQRTADPAWGKRLQARKSQLARERRDAVERPTSEATRIAMQFSAQNSQADVALQVRGYSRAFGARELFRDADLDIACGERVALLGPNGSGKTTFLRDVVEHGSWDHHALRVGPSLRVGYCAQQQESLRDDRTVLEEMTLGAGVLRDRAYGLLQQFMFGYHDVDKRVGDLSGGERNRLQLAKLIALQPDFLILDEPTNHLDIPACEAIEDALASFEGTILAVSHDRYFLDKIATRVVEVRDSGFASFDGNFSEYWAERQPPARSQKARVATRATARRASAAQPGRTAAASPLASRIEAMEQERQALEREAAEAFERGDHRAGSRAASKLEAHQTKLDRLYAQWLADEG